jgi:peptidoglycan hydrolase-like protein with peptidoglycan-binding domain
MNPPLDRTPHGSTRAAARRRSGDGRAAVQPDPRRSTERPRITPDPRVSRASAGGDPLLADPGVRRADPRRTGDPRATGEPRRTVRIDGRIDRPTDPRPRGTNDDRSRNDRSRNDRHDDRHDDRYREVPLRDVPAYRAAVGRDEHRSDRRPLFAAAAAATLLCAVIAFRGGDDADELVTPAVAAAEDTADAAAPADAASPAVAAGPAVATPASDPAALVAADPTAAGEVQDLDGDALTRADTCLMDELSVRLGDSGQSVTCLQQALTEQGFYTGPVSGQFDQATFVAVEAMQTDRELYVDGIVGRESAISLGIWPDEESFVTRTPPPPPGAVDLLGYPLSSVASAGADAPPLPENSGTGRRIVYDRAGQRVWAVGSEGEIIRSWLVSGSKYSNELPGTHEVYSKSEVSTAWNGKAYLPKMVRWLKTQKGAIGFHSIPLHVEDRSPYQTEAELGQRLSGGCQRQAVADADFLWEWADIGTKVVVI